MENFLSEVLLSQHSFITLEKIIWVREHSHIFTFHESFMNPKSCKILRYLIELHCQIMVQPCASMVQTCKLPEILVRDIFIGLDGLESFRNIPEPRFFLIFNSHFQLFLTFKPKTDWKLAYFKRFPAHPNRWKCLERALLEMFRSEPSNTHGWNTCLKIWSGSVTYVLHTIPLMHRFLPARNSFVVISPSTAIDGANSINRRTKHCSQGHSTGQVVPVPLCIQTVEDSQTISRPIVTISRVRLRPWERESRARKTSSALKLDSFVWEITA